LRSKIVILKICEIVLNICRETGSKSR